MQPQKTRTALVLVLAVAFLLPALATEAQTRVGKTELGFSFDLDDLTEGSDSRLRMTLRAGRYLGDRFEIGAELGSNGTFDDVTENLSYRLFAVYELNPGQTTVWYGRGGFAGLRFQDVSFEFLDAGLGFKTCATTPPSTGKPPMATPSPVRRGTTKYVR